MLSENIFFLRGKWKNGGVVNDGRRTVDAFLNQCWPERSVLMVCENAAKTHDESQGINIHLNVTAAGVKVVFRN